LRRTVSLTAVATLATATLALAAPVGQAAQATASPSHGVTVAHACATPTKKGEMACNALQVTAGTPRSAHAESDLTAAAAPSGFGPAVVLLWGAASRPGSTTGETGCHPGIGAVVGVPAVGCHWGDAPSITVRGVSVLTC